MNDTVTIDVDHLGMAISAAMIILVLSGLISPVVSILVCAFVAGYGAPRIWFRYQHTKGRVR